MNTDMFDFVKTEDALFHYTKAETVTSHILPTMRLKLSRFKDMNDPWEYKFRLLNLIGWSLPPEASDLSQKAHPIVDRILRSECRVGCFCTNNQPRLILEDGQTVLDPYALCEGWNKSRMWSQYGDNHFGACVVFSRKHLKTSIVNEFGVDLRYKCCNVSYSQKHRMSHKAFTLDGNRLVKEGLEKYSLSFVLGNMDEIYFIKHSDYRDEAECRIVIYDPSGKYESISIKDSIIGIIWGHRTTEHDLQKLEQLCIMHKVGCGHLHWDRGNPHLLLCTKPEKT